MNAPSHRFAFAPAVPAPIVAGAVLAACGIAAYANSLSAPLIFDDLDWVFSESSARIWPLATNRPILNLTFALQRAFGATEPAAFRGLNVAIHIAVGLILFALVRRTLRAKSSDRSPRHVDGLALVASALWLTHPLQTQSVTYVVQRSESLAGLFYISALYALSRSRDSRRPAVWYSVAIATCWVGLGVKETLVTAPIALLLYDRAVLAESWREIIRKRWALYVGLFSSWAWLAANVAPALHSSRASVGFARASVTPIEYLLSQPGVLLHYLRLVVWPEALSLDHYWTIARDAGTIAWQGGIILALVAWSFTSLWFRPAVGWTAFTAFLILAPTSSIVPIADLAVEHRMYLPSACVIVLAVVGLDRAVGRWNASRSGEPGRLGIHTRRIAFAICGVAIAVSIGLTLRRNEDYSDPERMWRSVLQMNPENPRAHNELGNRMRELGRDDEALLHYREAVAISDRLPHRPLAPFHYNLGSALHDLDQLREAIHHYRRALRLQPRSTRVLLNLGAALSATGDLAGAIDAYTKLLKLRPRHGPALNNMAIAYAAQGEHELAVARFRDAVSGTPRVPGVRRRLALALLAQGQTAEAVEEWNAILRDVRRAGSDAIARSIRDEARAALESIGESEWIGKLSATEPR